MESQSMFGDKKPNCVILDEIDGADAKGAIQAGALLGGEGEEGWMGARMPLPFTNELAL